MRSHEWIDQRSLALHEAVAKKLAEHPELLEVARQNLRQWLARNPQPALLDWQRLRAEALEPLLAGKSARWHAFDFDAGLRPDGTYALSEQSVERQAAPVILLIQTVILVPNWSQGVHLRAGVAWPAAGFARRSEPRP